MKLFHRKKEETQIICNKPVLASADRYSRGSFSLPATVEPLEKELYDRLRLTVPVIDAAIMKIIRLAGGFRLVCSDERFQERLDYFSENVPVGLAGKSLGVFADCYLDSLITYGSAIGEIAVNSRDGHIEGLYNGDVSSVDVREGSTPFTRSYFIKGSSDGRALPHPERILYSTLTGGRSLLRGLPALSGILMRIYECIGQNFDRAGNVRYAVTYKPSPNSGEAVYSKERAMQIAREWADGMNSARCGQVKDFVAVGDVDIKVIGADNCILDTNVPVRQLLEQITAKLSIPPFLLGLNWSSTERMSSQQADILTSELEYYRRILTPVLTDTGNAFLCSEGIDAVCRTEWDIINLQDETALAEARLKNAQAREIEARLDSEK